jgi:hypothetical protein
MTDPAPVTTIPTPPAATAPTPPVAFVIADATTGEIVGAGTCPAADFAAHQESEITLGRVAVAAPAGTDPTANVVDITATPPTVIARPSTQPVPVGPAWRAYQAQAQAMLDRSDRTILRCAENAVAVPSAWSDYRNALRAIISAATGDPAATLPAMPAYPAGT